MVHTGVYNLYGLCKRRYFMWAGGRRFGSILHPLYRPAHGYELISEAQRYGKTTYMGYK